MIQLQEGIELRHTIMPARLQKTPYGDVTLTSYWQHDRYYLRALGLKSALQWMFPGYKGQFESTEYGAVRHTFKPSKIPITIERKLRQKCAEWQGVWDNRLADFACQVEASQGKGAIEQIHTVKEAIERYQAVRSGELAPGTKERNRHYLGRWLPVLGADTLLTELTEDRLITSRTSLSKELKASTINCMLALLKSVLRWVEGRSIPIHPAYRLLRGVREVTNAREKAWWTAREVGVALEAAAEVDRDLVRNPEAGSPGTATLLIALGCLLGLRYEEITKQRWQDVDLDGKDWETGAPAPVIHIVPYDGWQPKDGEARAIPMHQRLVEIVRPYYKPTGWVLKANKVMPKHGGTMRVYRYDPKKIWELVLKRAMAKGAKRITPNGMRHSFASNLLMAGVSDVMVARWLGHADTSMVHKHYGHLLQYHGDINRLQIGPVGPV